jgi:hypothetical protein
VVIKRDPLEQGLGVVIAVRAPPHNAQVEIDLRRSKVGVLRDIRL